MEFTDALLRLTVLDPAYVSAVLDGRNEEMTPRLEARVLAFVRIAALACSGATQHAFAIEVDAGIRAGATPNEIVGILTGIAPIIGSAAVAEAAPALALALGFDTEMALEQEEQRD